MGKRNAPSRSKKLRAVARAIFQELPNPEKLADLGFEFDDIAETLGLVWDDGAADYLIDVWPCNAEAVSFFRKVCSQWRTNGTMPYGLDYNTFPLIFDLMQIPDDRKRIVFDSVRVMEEAALSEMKSQFDERRSQKR